MVSVDNPRLRPGQRLALERWTQALAAGSRSELVVVPVGYGKTIIGVGSFAIAAAGGHADACLYLTPTDVLRTQVYHGLERALEVLDARLDVRKYLAENATLHRAAANRANVIVATYQQVAAAPQRYAKLCARQRVHLVCDEAHHLGERGQWAAALRALPVATTMLLSATPVRLDREPLAGARYVPAEDGEGLVIDPLVHVTLEGLRLPWLTTLERMGYVPMGTSPLPLLLLVALGLWALWCRHGPAWDRPASPPAA